jgi:hypothetical protein
MLAENLAYALTQVLHNFGAVVVVGSAAFALWAPALPPGPEKRLARLAGFGWVVQIASGAGISAIGYYYYSRFPEIHGVAAAAFAIKVTCATAGLALALLLQLRGDRWSETRRRLCWRALAVLAATALAAAAFLRWFS